MKAKWKESCLLGRAKEPDGEKAEEAKAACKLETETPGSSVTVIKLENEMSSIDQLSICQYIESPKRGE